MPTAEIQDPELRALKGLHVYGATYSNNVGRVLLMLEEKRLTYDLHGLDLIGTKNLEAPYLRLHPEGTIPALVHDGKAISNSNDILRYIEETFPNPSFSPEDPAQQAEMWRLVDEAATCHIKCVKAQFYAFGMGRPCSDAALERYRTVNPELYEFHNAYRGGMTPAQKAEIHQRNATNLTMLEDRLTQGAYLLGDSYSVADIAWVTNVIFLERMGYKLAPYKAVCAWKIGIESRPSVNSRSRIPKIPVPVMWLICKLARFRMRRS